MGGTQEPGIDLDLKVTVTLQSKLKAEFNGCFLDNTIKKNIFVLFLT